MFHIVCVVCVCSLVKVLLCYDPSKFFSSSCLFVHLINYGLRICLYLFVCVCVCAILKSYVGLVVSLCNFFCASSSSSSCCCCCCFWVLIVEIKYIVFLFKCYVKLKLSSIPWILVFQLLLLLSPFSKWCWLLLLLLLLFFLERSCHCLVFVSSIYNFLSVVVVVVIVDVVLWFGLLLFFFFLQ